MEKTKSDKAVCVMVKFVGFGCVSTIYEYKEGKDSGIDEAIERLKGKVMGRLKDKGVNIFSSVMQKYAEEGGYFDFEVWFLDEKDVVREREEGYSRGSSKGSLGVPGVGKERDDLDTYSDDDD